MRYLALLLLCGCVHSGPYSTELHAGVISQMGERKLGRDPIGMIQVTQPLPLNLELTYTHLSSIPDSDIATQFDGVGIGVCVRFPLRGCRQ